MNRAGIQELHYCHEIIVSKLKLDNWNASVHYSYLVPKYFSENEIRKLILAKEVEFAEPFSILGSGVGLKRTTNFENSLFILTESGLNKYQDKISVDLLFQKQEENSLLGKLLEAWIESVELDRNKTEFALGFRELVDCASIASLKSGVAKGLIEFFIDRSSTKTIRRSLYKPYPVDNSLLWFGTDSAFTINDSAFTKIIHEGLNLTEFRVRLLRLLIKKIESYNANNSPSETGYIVEPITTESEIHKTFAATQKLFEYERISRKIHHKWRDLLAFSRDENENAEIAAEDLAELLREKLETIESEEDGTVDNTSAFHVFDRPLANQQLNGASGHSVAQSSNEIANIKPELSRLLSEFDDLRTSYPKIFAARLVGNLIDQNLWQRILGEKLIVELSAKPIETEVFDQTCIYSDKSSDELLAKHACQKLNGLCCEIFRAVDTLPADFLELSGIKLGRFQSWVDWLIYIDEFAFESFNSHAMSGCERQQFKLLDSKGSIYERIPLLASQHIVNLNTKLAFDHRWFSILSPDVCSCSTAVISHLIHKIPEFGREITICKWKHDEGDEETWTTYGHKSLDPIFEQKGNPNLVFKTKGQGVGSDRQICELKKILPGSDSATAYHRLIAEMISKLFYNELSEMSIEQEINDGRKRVDICFNNNAEHGFFYHLKTTYKINCPIIMVECKNYSCDVGNPELDQLTGRLGDKRGRFGMLFCRRIDDKRKLLSRCKDILNNGNGYVVVFTDEDICQLWTAKLNQEQAMFEKLLYEKLKELIL